MFNSLYSLGGVEGVRVLDLFAGTGAMGIEALSRGAAEVVFVERSPGAVAALGQNLEIAGVTDRARVVTTDVLRYLEGCPDHFDLAIVDPPYRFDAWADLLPRVPADVVVVESGVRVEPPAGWETHRSKRYGGTFVSIVSPGPPGPDPAESSPP